ncbi:histidine utilization repressor [Microvirga sp. 2MCAF38]|uniref:histidine utilization repressor n=1 Tax=Microvirga sp. 2MCAF38 TaxID=3232989 RepID=UPI003F94A967
MATEENVPIYAEIQRDVERKIMSGAWPPGHRVPSEAELVAQYGCSRMTANKAMSNLAASGMIVRRRRSGSFVGPPRVQEPLLRIQDIRAEILATGRSHRFKILRRNTRIASTQEDAAHVGVPVGTPILTLEIIHYADDEHFAVENRQINLAVVPEAAEESFKTIPPGTWLLQNVPWTEAEHAIRALPADRVTSQRLKIPFGDVCLSIARRTWKADRLVTFVRIIYPGDRHRFVARFTPSSSL